MSTDETVHSVIRAMALLDAFGVADAQLALAELSRRTRIPKPSALRLARTLAEAGYLVALDGGAWRLGPAAARLGARYQRGFDLTNLIEPALQDIAGRTGHGASFFTLEGRQRVRLLRVLGADGFASPTRVGEPLPLDRGAAGQVFLAFSEGGDKTYPTIRRRGYHVTVGEADVGSASIAAPVMTGHGQLIGALSLAAQAGENAAQELERHAPVLIDAARRLSQAFARSEAKNRAGMDLQRWHPG